MSFVSFNMTCFTKWLFLFHLLNTVISAELQQDNSICKKDNVLGNPIKIESFLKPQKYLVVFPFQDSEKVKPGQIFVNFKEHSYCTYYQFSGTLELLQLLVNDPKGINENQSFAYNPDSRNYIYDWIDRNGIRRFDEGYEVMVFKEFWSVVVYKCKTGSNNISEEAVAIFVSPDTNWITEDFQYVVNATLTAIQPTTLTSQIFPKTLEYACRKREHPQLTSIKRSSVEDESTLQVLIVFINILFLALFFISIGIRENVWTCGDSRSVVHPILE